jgi:Zn-dependent peptidase ImmA (M78 family)
VASSCCYREPAWKEARFICCTLAWISSSRPPKPASRCSPCAKRSGPRRCTAGRSPLCFCPSRPVEEPQEQQFRRLPGAPEPPWPPEMQLLPRRVRERQDAALELYEALDEPPPWPAAVEILTATRQVLPELVRRVLGVGFDEQASWRDQSGYRGLRQWTDAVEALGVLVLQDGSMPVETMRGFAAMHAQVPVIVVNTQDDARARAFTIIHELGHLYLAALGQPVGPETESWCDAFAGEVLIPGPQLEIALVRLRGRASLAIIDAIALEFGVTPHAAAVRVAKARLLDQLEIDDVIDEIRRRQPRERGGGGDCYRTQLGRLSPTFAKLVFTALDSQAVTSPAASSLLGGVKVSNFAKLREYLNRRAAGA